MLNQAHHNIYKTHYARNLREAYQSFAQQLSEVTGYRPTVLTQEHKPLERQNLSEPYINLRQVESNLLDCTPLMTNLHPTCLGSSTQVAYLRPLTKSVSLPALPSSSRRLFLRIV
jgi:hypothetical protein